MDTNRTSILPARFRDNATNTSVDGRGTAVIHPELSHEQQSGERELVASEGITREVTAEESRKSSSSGGNPDLERPTGQRCGDRELQEEHGGQIPPAHGLERGAAGKKGLLPLVDCVLG